MLRDSDPEGVLHRVPSQLGPGLGAEPPVSSLPGSAYPDAVKELNSRYHSGDIYIYIYVCEYIDICICVYICIYIHM